MNLREKLRVDPGKKARLEKRDPAATCGLRDKESGGPLLAKSVARLADLQYLLYAEGRRSLLVVLQAMDTGGKDGVIRHVFSGLNPQGCKVTSFKAPSALELAHDFLWRIHAAVPARGEIGVFNRSHYEDVAIVRVHELVPEAIWSKRYERINAFERGLAEGGTRIVKFFLHISKEEQKRRLEARLADPAKRWKFQPGDLAERKRWREYTEAYEDALTKCSTAWAEWYVIPADRKWVRNVAVARILVEVLEEMKPKLPEPTFDPRKIRIV